MYPTVTVSLARVPHCNPTVTRYLAVFPTVTRYLAVFPTVVVGFGRLPTVVVGFGRLPLWWWLWPGLATTAGLSRQRLPRSADWLSLRLPLGSPE